MGVVSPSVSVGLCVCVCVCVSVCLSVCMSVHRENSHGWPSRPRVYTVASIDSDI